MEYLKFWWDCVSESWELFGRICDFAGITATIVSGIFLWRKREEWKEKWEKTLVLVLFWLFPIVFLGSMFLYQPYSKFEDSERERDALVKKGPQLDGFIDQHLIGTQSDSNVLAILQVSVFNSGDYPSIADAYSLKVTTTNHTTVEGDLVDIPDEYTMFSYKTNSPMAIPVLLTVKRAELISEKTAKAIGKGEGPRGWIAFRFRGVPVDRFEGTNIVLSFMDVRGTRIYVTNGMWKGKPGDPMVAEDVPRALPGSDNLMSKSISQYLITNTPGVPPELPPDCTNVTVYFGAQGSILPKFIAEVGSEFGNEFNIKDLPDFAVAGMDKDPGYSRLKRTIWIKKEPSYMTDFGGKQARIPILPHIISNRVYMELAVPYNSKIQRLVLNDDFDSELTGLPNGWDRNYSTNSYVYEIVNENTNPVLQVFYITPNEIHVNGIFILDTNEFVESFGEMPKLSILQWSLVDTNNPNFTNNLFSLFTGRDLATNTIGQLLTNAIYDAKFPYQRAIFKYPSNRHPGEFAH